MDKASERSKSPVRKMKIGALAAIISYILFNDAPVFFGVLFLTELGYITGVYVAFTLKRIGKDGHAADGETVYRKWRTCNDERCYPRDGFIIY
jgi:hypothetical protein